VERNDAGQDVFIPPGELNGAMDGDMVEVSFTAHTKGPRGRVTSIRERSEITVCGSYRRLKRWGILDPIKPFPYPIVIPHGCQGDAQDGDMVLARISRPDLPRKTSAVSATVQHRIDLPADISADIRMVVLRHGLSWAFSPQALTEAHSAAAIDMQAELRRRRDLRDRVVFTIDGPDARDFDDAVGIEPLEDGTLLMTVAIADVAHLVHPGGALDREAFQRSFSVYFPETSIPMLPAVLSAGALSLKPLEERLALVVEMRLGPRGRLLEVDCCEAVIRSRARLTYPEADAYLGGQAAPQKIEAAVGERLQVLNRIARQLRSRRQRAGALCFDLPEVRFRLDVNGQVEGISRRIRGASEILIEEAMLLTNAAVCAFLEQRGMPVLYRVHPTPAPNDLAEFAQVMRQVAPRMPTPGKRKGSHSRKAPVSSNEVSRPKIHAALQEALHTGSGLHRVFQDIAQAYQGDPLERFVTQQMLRSMKQAAYAHEDSGHFGLARRGYLHFTSPIRRYPDLIVHRLVKLALSAEGLTPKARTKWRRYLKYAGPLVSGLERKADEAMQDVARIKAVALLSTRLGEEFSGIVINIQSFGVFVELKDYPADGLITSSKSPTPATRQARRSKTTTSELTLGELVKVRLARVDPLRGLIDLTLA